MTTTQPDLVHLTDALTEVLETIDAEIANLTADRERYAAALELIAGSNGTTPTATTKTKPPPARTTKPPRPTPRRTADSTPAKDRTCVCGRVSKSMAGHRAHQRNCNTFQAAIPTADTPAPAAKHRCDYPGCFETFTGRAPLARHRREHNHYTDNDTTTPTP